MNRPTHPSLFRAGRHASWLVLAALAACGGATTPDTPGPAVLINQVSGTNQTAPVASVAPNPLVVEVLDSKQRGVPGITVSWTVTAGNGVASGSTITDTKGMAQTQFSVGTVAGNNEITASASGLSQTTKFEITGTALSLSKVLAASHTLYLSCGVDTGRVSANTTDKYGNAVTGAVSWVSRDPTVATVDASGAVHLLKLSGSTYLVATATGADADSVLVQGAPPLTLAAAQVDTLLPGNVFCVESTQAGSEYMLQANYSSTTPGNSATVTVTGTGLGTLGSGANVIPGQTIAGAGVQPFTPVKVNNGFEIALRNRERTELTPLVPAARAWYNRSLPVWRAARNAAPGSAAALAARTVQGSAPLAQQIPATAKVGDLVQLNTNANSACSSPTMTTARVTAISNSAIVVADTSNPAGGFTDSDYQSFATAMDTLVMPVDTTTFGSPSDIDNNGHVVILFTKAVNALTVDASQGIVLGFYYSRDLLPVTQCPGSNVSEMFYLLVPDPSGTVNGGNSFTAKKSNVTNIVVGTIGHEFQHLINASRRIYIDNSPIPYEETWLNEGLSHIAEELIFYRAAHLTPRQDIGSLMLTDQSIYTAFSLYMAGNEGRYETLLPVTEQHGPIGEFSNDDQLPTRAATWTYLRYLADHRPTDSTFFYRLVNSQTSGLNNIQAVIGGDPMAPMRRWATSMYVNGTVDGVDPAYDQLSWNWPEIYGYLHATYIRPVSHTLVNSSPTSVALASDGVAYFRFAVSNGGQGLISVSGGASGLPTGVQLTLVRTK